MQFLKLLWDMASCVSCLFEAWRRTLWADIKTEDLLEETAQLLRQVQASPSAGLAATAHA